jgi:UDP-N-acetyl-D-mannosaminuronic acid dehydrogenase
LASVVDGGLSGFARGTIRATIGLAIAVEVLERGARIASLVTHMPGAYAVNSSDSRQESFDLCVVGGAGHVGLPLSIVFASKGLRVLIHDLNKDALETIAGGEVPFMERGATPLLRDAIANNRLCFTTDPADVARASSIVIVIGTPVDEFLNPSLKPLMACIDTLFPYLSDDQLLILRSTVYPGVTESIGKHLAARRKATKIAFCPERIVQGYAIEELQSLPQLVSGTTPEAEDAAARLFSLIAPRVVRMVPIEAELVKLYSNAYRYIQFATTNQFYLIANSAGADYFRIMEAMKDGYPRMADIPGHGFAAGPCLFKDTMQLTAFYRNQFSIGQAAMLVNESLPLFVVDSLAARHKLEDKTVGLLGMAFKAESDDPRSSLSYKLKKLLAFRAKEVLTTDPYVTSDPTIVPLEEVLSRSDILVLCAPHRAYRELDLQGKEFFDVWNLWAVRELQGTAH